MLLESHYTFKQLIAINNEAKVTPMKANISCSQQLAVKNVKWGKSWELKQTLNFFILVYNTSIHTQTNLNTFKC